MKISLRKHQRLIYDPTDIKPSQMVEDEVKQICWATKDVLLWMQQNNMTNFSELEQYFLSRVQDMATSNDKV